MIARVSKALNKKDGEQGFTLIELLVVVIIIGILAAIAIPVFLNQRKSAVDASIKSDLRTVATNLETWMTEHQKYPDSATQAAAGGPVVLKATGATDVSIPVSSGNVITVTLTGATVAAGTFLIEGYNANGNASEASKAIKYDSDGGGLK
ncbi:MULTISPECIES: type II secretion system protein [Cellulomonas]|uniref:type II secretion system protein n=1 Tax=Cellulomonas TaxID=1707 RepID=UPI0006253F0A|nr:MULTISPECIES: prepilin-type N-terminal cleavage/methylation domain-containing protein [Cellulomonas]